MNSDGTKYQSSDEAGNKIIIDHDETVYPGNDCQETARKCVGRIVESNIAVSSGKVNLEEARPNKEGLYG